MDIREKILALFEKRGQLKTGVLVSETGFSRAYINVILNELRNEGHIVLLGSGRGAFYVATKNHAIEAVRRHIVSIKKRYKRGTIDEDTIFSTIDAHTGIFKDLSSKCREIIRYAFTEMVNNAIDHSQSEFITIAARKRFGNVVFEVQDKGVGIFRNIIQKGNANNELEAIQELLKGKQTTDPKHHSGEGIFFTSKVADQFTIISGHYKLIFDNHTEHDVAVQPLQEKKGTRVIFTLQTKSTRSLETVFKKFTDDQFEFSKTLVRVRLHSNEKTSYVSRSEAKRILTGLEKFKTIALDFQGISTVGQSFCDEIFRVWHSEHRNIAIIIENENEAIDFMIQRARKNVL